MVWSGDLGFEPWVFVPEPPNHRSKPPIGGKLRVVLRPPWKSSPNSQSSRAVALLRLLGAKLMSGRGSISCLTCRPKSSAKRIVLN